MSRPAGELHVFARSPEAGRGKTRLAASLGERFALELSRAFLLDVGRLLDVPGLRTVLRIDGPPDRLPGPLRAARIVPQRPVGLGDRIADAFHEAFDSGAELALVAGSDSPTEGADRISEAADLLRTGVPAVVRPAEDGGFVLLGMRRTAFSPELLDGIPWSTPDVGGRLAANFAAAGTPLRSLEPGFDVDVEADLGRLVAALRAAPGLAPATERFLAGERLLP